MASCFDCGSEVAPEDRFCGNCGIALQPGGAAEGEGAPAPSSASPAGEPSPSAQSSQSGGAPRQDEAGGRQDETPGGQDYSEEDDAAMRAMVEGQIEAESLPMFLSGRIYDDGVIDPRDTRTVLGICLSVIHNAAVRGTERFGVFRP